MIPETLCEEETGDTLSGTGTLYVYTCTLTVKICSEELSSHS